MIKMSEPDAAVLARRSEIVAALQAIVPGEGVIEAERERRAFERDSLIAYRTARVLRARRIPARSQEAKQKT